jgi:hypothetical protein
MKFLLRAIADVTVILAASASIAAPSVAMASWPTAPRS